MIAILGAGGTIAHHLLNHLPEQGSRIRLISRRGITDPRAQEAVAADLNRAEAVMQALDGCQTAYLVAGLAYRASVWETEWPLVMRHTLEACAKQGTRLVFFDNVYAYGPVEGPMTESTPYRATSRKGRVRAAIAQMLMEAVDKGRVDAMIVRSADFYGPHCSNSMFNMLVTTRQAAGKKAQWMGMATLPHSLTYTPDAGKYTAWLGNRPEAYNHVWHLPTAAPAPTITELAEQSAALLQAPKGVQCMPAWMMHPLGWFIKPVQESIELLYQFDRPYHFDSSKAEKAYGLVATPYAEAIKALCAEASGNA